MMLNKEVFGKNLQRYRIDRGLSISQMAEKCDATTAHMRQIEATKKLPSLPMLLSICEALDVTPDALLLDSIREIRINEIDDIIEVLKTLRPDYFRIVCKIIEEMKEQQK